MANACRRHGGAIALPHEDGERGRRNGDSLRGSEPALPPVAFRKQDALGGTIRTTRRTGVLDARRLAADLRRPSSPTHDHAVEYTIGVSGQAGNVDGRVNGEGNAFEGIRRRPYPMPPLRSTGWTDLTHSAARTLGWHPFPVPAAINSEPYAGRPDCTFCGFCQHNGCYRNAKGSPDVSLLPLAEATGLLSVHTEARAIRIETTPQGLARGVTFLHAGRELFQPARTVLLAGFVYENTRLMLLSASDQHPRGLANNSMQVGRHYGAHLVPFVFGLFPGKNLNRWSGSGGQITCVDDWNGDAFDHVGLDFIGGGLLMAMGEQKPIALTSTEGPGTVPRWGKAWKDWIRRNAGSIGSAFGQFENLPYEENYLDLDPTARDPLGFPVIRVTHALHANERRGWEFLREKLREWLLAAGAAETWGDERILIDGRHPYGGTRMGTDPDSSVADSHGFSHEVPNLGFLGASTFPTSGGHNPTLTVQALAWRTAEHLLTDADHRRSPA